MIVSLHVFVCGKPTPKGSFKPMRTPKTGRVFLKPDSSDALTTWMQAIRNECCGKIKTAPPSVGVSMIVEFRFSRPKKDCKKDGTTKPTAPMCYTKKPDLDKLLRAVSDALTGVAYEDDSQLCYVVGHKTYVDAGSSSPQGAAIDISWDAANQEERHG